ncbi:aquaporin-9-like isoform X2 [Amphibalanus amphitrite]|uniref:aquaporin-9-like isoform X2 n=1 Tax=Amphibalanus amphitrite TaxID=1232801 RepID=UPI001C901FE0|nr:aquaporin-9-like isoform X2 [Amphibalanus amphitrite]
MEAPDGMWQPTAAIRSVIRSSAAPPDCRATALRRPTTVTMLLRLRRLRSVCRLRHPLLRETLAELLGTAVLVFIGNSTIANNVRNPLVAAVNVPLGYVAAVMIAVFATGGVSGGHINPAVTLALCLSGRCDLTRLLPFTGAQYIGGFIGALLTHILFFDLIQSDTDRLNPTIYGIFSTYPNNSISIGGAFFDQVLGTAILVFGIMAISDKQNMNVPKPLLPVGVGIVLYGAIASSCSNTGAALNPARDLGPRIYSFVIGYRQVFSVGHQFWWIPVVAGYIGGLLGAFVYLFCIELHHPTAEGDEQREGAPPAASRGCEKDGWENGALQVEGCL